MKPITWWPGLGSSHIHHQLGLVAQLAANHPTHGRLPMACLKHWTEPALRHRQIGFFFDENNRPLGYVTWAWFDGDVEQRWVQDSNVLLHESEWNEGDRLWFLDGIIRRDFLREAQRKLANEVFPSVSRVSWLHRDRLGRTTRIARLMRVDGNLVRSTEIVQPALV